MSKDTVRAEQFYPEYCKTADSYLQFDEAETAAAFPFADALSQHNIEALEAKLNELAAWKQSALAQLAKADKLREVLAEQPKYLGWDMYEAVADYVSALKAELSALRGKETEPTPLPVVQTAAPRKHTTWTEVKAEMDAPPVALPTPPARSDKDYAIEHGGYLADAVEHYLEERNKFDALEQLVDVSDQDSLNDHFRALRDCVHEFRKRAQRAKQPVALPTEEEERKEFIEDVAQWLRDRATSRAKFLATAQTETIRAMEIQLMCTLREMADEFLARRPLSMTTEKEK